MKPLDLDTILSFEKRFDGFKGSEIFSIEIITPKTIKLFLNVQDSLKGFDWIGLEFLFEDVIDAKLIENEKLHLLNMPDGFTFLKQDGIFAFACDKYKNIDGTKNALCYIISKSVKYSQKNAKI